MSRPAILNAATRKVGRQILVTRKHSPTILVAVGAVGLVSTVVLACRATLKVDEILTEAEGRRKKIEMARNSELEGEQYTEEDAQQDGIKVKTQTALKIAKAYAPAVVVGVATICAFGGSHVIVTRRYAALSAAYATVDRGFKEYRKRVIDEYGHDKDREFRFGTITRELAVDTDEGVAVKTVKTSAPPGPSGYSGYAMFFTRENSSCWKSTPHHNQAWVRSQQAYANDLLRAQGHVTLNDVRKMLGFRPVPEGQLVGWIKGANETGTGDGYIDFGIANTYEGQRFINGEEDSVIIDPNVDGEIWRLIS